MLKMAQQLAEAEAQQNCEQQLQTQSTAKACTPQQELDSQPQQAQSATGMAELLHGARMAAGVLQLTKHWQQHNQVPGLEHILGATR